MPTFSDIFREPTNMELDAWFTEHSATDRDAHDNTALHWAARYGHLGVCERLLQSHVESTLSSALLNTLKQFDSKQKSPSSMSSTRNSAMSSSQETLVLADRGLDAFKNRPGSASIRTTLLGQEGAQQAHQEYERRAQELTRAANAAGDRPLHYAVAEDHLSLVEWLVANGADVNAANDHGNTALHYAAYWKRESIAKFLIVNKAVLLSANKYKRTALDQARSQQWKDQLKSWAQENGQNLGQIIVTQTRSIAEAALLARHKFLADTNVPLVVTPTALTLESLVPSLARHGRRFDTYHGHYHHQVSSQQPQALPVLVRQYRGTVAPQPKELTQLQEELLSLRKWHHSSFLPVLGLVTHDPAHFLIFHDDIPPSFHTSAFIQGWLHPDPPVDATLFTYLSHVQLQRRLHPLNDNQTLKRHVDWIKQLVECLVFLHDTVNAAHGALSDTTLLITADGIVKCMDYGYPAPSLVDTTRAPQNLFTNVSYLAPELLRESQDATTWKRADIYSLGMIAYGLLVGCVPYARVITLPNGSVQLQQANPMALGLQLALRQQVLPLDQHLAHSPFRSLVEQCCHAEPSLRPTARHVRDSLNSISLF